MQELLLAVVLFGQGASSISGRILSMDGTPAANMRVGAVAVLSAPQQSGDSAILSVAETDSSGDYRLENVPPGRYYISVGNVGNPTYFPGVADSAKATVLTVGAGAALSGMDFAMVVPFVLRPLQTTQAAPALPRIPMVMKTVYLAKGTTTQEMNDVVAAATVKLSAGRIVSNSQANAIILRDTPDNVAAAEKAIIDMDKRGGGALVISGVSPATAFATDAAGNITVIEAGRSQRVRTGPQLQLKSTTPISIHLNEDVRVLYQTLADMAGLRVILDRDFGPPSPVNFSADNIGILDALDLLSAQTNTFWHVLNSNTILMAPESAFKHREYDPQIVKTIYLNNTTTPQGITDIVDAGRTMLSLPYIVANTQMNAIVLRDTPNQIALAEKIIADLDVSANGGSPPVQAQNGFVTVVGNFGNTNSIFVLEAGRVRDVTPKRALLRPKVTGPVSINMTENVRVAFETLTGLAGLNVIFDRDLAIVGRRIQAFHVDNVNILDALDLLSIQTNTFWEVLDSKTIMVSPESSVKHLDYDMQILKTITLTNTSTPQSVNDIVTAVRTLFGLGYIEAYPQTNRIVVRDTPGKVALAEKVIADLDQPRGAGRPAPTSQFLPVTAIGMNSFRNLSSVFILTGGEIRNVTPKRAELQLATGTPTSVQINETARVGFETLARMGGLTVTFDPRLGPGGNLKGFNAENIGILDAFDYFSLLTNSFWQVVDSNTILVAPESNVVRRELEPKVTRTFTLSHAQTQQAAIDIVTVARTILNLPQIRLTAPGQIEIVDTPNRLALAEKIIADLDQPQGN